MKSFLIITAALSICVLSPTPALSGNADSINVIPASTMRIIKWNPFAMFDLIPAAQFSYEHPFGLNRTMQHEVGFISHTVNPFLAFNKNVDITGIKLRTEIRYYTGQGKGDGDFYVAPEIGYKYYVNKSTDWFSRYDGSYEQMIDYIGKRHVIGANIKFGQLYHFGATPLAWDIFVGFGLKYRYVTSDLPVDAVPLGPTEIPAINELYYTAPGGSLRFNVTGGIRLCYVLPKRM